MIRGSPSAEVADAECGKYRAERELPCRGAEGHVMGKSHVMQKSHVTVVPEVTANEGADKSGIGVRGYSTTLPPLGTKCGSLVLGLDPSSITTCRRLFRVGFMEVPNAFAAIF